MNPEDLGGFFPLIAIRSLMYRDDRLEDIQPLSKASGDTAKVIIIPLSIGQYLSKLDGEESIFHLEHYPGHSEVWLAFEWKESNARRTRQRDRCEQERAASDKHNRRIKELLEAMPEQLESEFNSHVAFLALKNLKDTVIQGNKVLELLGIAELLTRYQQEDNEEPTKDTL